ncbi:hypothetical protein A3860_18175 [Niastella vici]|uniref:Uncharacterized protein n=1 Tax=Niastella vici TaxID=1703345 RepID=A0A1V9G221_9BACT|nr:DUF5696 domain-containing protein [Niastella vici]OQP64689.1 hypothetical protein A3860_18175 [Niastella vici]
MKPKHCHHLIFVFVFFLFFSQALFAQTNPVRVTNQNGTWAITGKKQTVIVKESDLSVRIRAGRVQWNMVPSGVNDMIVKRNGKEFTIRLADAGKRKVEPYEPGFKTGIIMTLEGWKDIDCKLYLTLALEGPDEDLVFDVAAAEKQTVVRQLNWPTALEAGEVDYTVLSNVRGVLLPRKWPKPYNPIRSSEPDGSIKKTDRSELQSNVIEDWSMSWWGFQKGTAAMMIIIETPDDAAYQFNHPAGGPTVIGPRWRASLGKFSYPRTGRMCFIPEGNYVQMAKRYRKYVMETGLFIPLTEKIAKNPQVKQLIGTPIIRSGILTDYKEGGDRWKRDTATRYRLTTFDQRAEEFRQWKQKGLNNLMVVLTGWPKMGYDRQHPDVLPPAPAAGGYEGMKRLQNALNDLGYLFVLHDQYRDYYVDAPSFNKQFAIHEEDSISLPAVFPGTRFGDFKEGNIPYMDYWDGGKMSYLSSTFMLGHVKKNYQGLFENGIHPSGSYLDVFGYVPPDEDFSPQHPATRTTAMRHRIGVYNWVRANLGIVGTEAACDWTVPYVDFSSPLNARNGIPIPLWDLVYHEAILTTYNYADLRGLLYAGLPQLGRGFEINKENLEMVRRMGDLNKRLAFTEMVKHEFLDSNYKKERTVFADGTTVTVDWEKKTVDVVPE